MRGTRALYGLQLLVGEGLLELMLPAVLMGALEGLDGLGDDRLQHIAMSMAHER